MWGREAVAAVTSVAFCPSWPVCCVCVCLETVPICNNTGLCLKFRTWIQAAPVFTEAHDSLGRWRNVFGTYRQACTASVCICVSVYTQRAASLGAPPSERQTMFLQLRSPPPSVSAPNHTSGAFPLPRLCPAPPLCFGLSASPVQAFIALEFPEFMPTSRWLTIPLG